MVGRMVPQLPHCPLGTSDYDFIWRKGFSRCHKVYDETIRSSQSLSLSISVWQEGPRPRGESGGSKGKPRDWGHNLGVRRPKHRRSPTSLELWMGACVQPQFQPIGLELPDMGPAKSESSNSHLDDVSDQQDRLP